MQIYGPASLHGPQSISAPHNRATQQISSFRPAAAADEVQISSQADMVSRMADIPDIRHDRVQSLRAAIASGTYETDAKISVALDRLLDEFA